MNTIPTVTKNLLIINVLMFLGTVVAQSYGIDLNQYLGLHFFLAGDFNAAQLITYMFMHGGFTHLFFNMFAVWMFGRILEQVWGPKRFLFYYLVCGIGAGLIQELVQYIHYETVLSAYDSVNTGYSVIPMKEYLNMMTTVGASGSVYAILLGFGMLFPNQPCLSSAAFPHQSQIFCHRIRLDRIIFRLCQQSGRQRRTLCALGRHDIRFYTNNVLEKKEQRKWLLL